MRVVAHISDIHFGREIPVVNEALVKDLHAQNPALVINSGDLTQRAREGQFRRARAFLDRLPKPLLSIPGNHDIPLYNLFRRFGSPFGRFKRIASPELNPVWSDEELLVIGLNSSRPFLPTKGYWKDGTLSAEQLELVRKTCAGDLRIKIIFTHHPFIPPPGSKPPGEIIIGAKTFLPVLEQSGVDLLLAGHLHKKYCGDVCDHHEEAVRSMLSIQAGTISRRVRKEPQSYNLLMIERDRVTIDVRTFRDGFFQTHEVKRYERIHGAWSAVE